MQGKWTIYDLFAVTGVVCSLWNGTLLAFHILECFVKNSIVNHSGATIMVKLSESVSGPTSCKDTQPAKL